MPNLLMQATQTLLEEGRLVRALDLIHDARAHTKRFGPSDNRYQAFDAFELSLPAPFGALSAALMPLDDLKEVELSDAALDDLVPLLSQHSGPLRVLLVWLAATNERAAEAVLQDALGESTQPEEAEADVRTAAAGGC